MTRDGTPFGAAHGAGYRAIYDLADRDRSRWIAATGQSGHPLSRHYGDLSTLAWREGRYLTDGIAVGSRTMPGAHRHAPPDASRQSGGS